MSFKVWGVFCEKRVHFKKIGSKNNIRLLDFPKKGNSNHEEDPIPKRYNNCQF